MAYSSGGLIAATDYNSFANGTNQINQFWNVGSGSAGYGQTALSAVSASGTVTATQWSTMLNYVNAAAAHQGISGVGTLGSSITSGVVATYIANLGTAINNAYSSRLSFASQGSTTTGTVYSPNITAANNTTYGAATVFQRVVTFSSGDAARYFFNAGGQINLVITSVTANDGTSRSTDAATTIGTYLGGVSAFRATTNGGRTGSGGTLNTNNTSFGYYNLTSTNVITHQVTSTNATYTNTVSQVYFGSNGTNLAGNGDAGSVINIYLNFTDGHNNYGGGFNDTLNITINHRVDIVYPESTNLSNTWGTVTVS